MALGRLALADAVMIQYTSPVFVALLAPFYLGEASRRRDRWALAAALAGVALVVRPGLGLNPSGALIGLTGGIGTGKSAVSALLSELGAAVECSDVIVHELQAPGAPGLLGIVERFGEQYLALQSFQEDPMGPPGAAG